MTETAVRKLDIDGIMARAKAAAEAFRYLDQEQTDRIVTAVYRAGFNARVRLAKMAAEETGLGEIGRAHV